jgi:hypothetical protein
LSSCSDCDVNRPGSVSFHFPFFKSVLDCNRLVCSSCKAMVGSLSVATTAVSSAKFTVVDSGEVHRLTVYSRYNNGRKTLPWGKRTLAVHSVHSVSNPVPEGCKYRDLAFQVEGVSNEIVKHGRELCGISTQE